MLNHPRVRKANRKWVWRDYWGNPCDYACGQWFFHVFLIWYPSMLPPPDMKLCGMSLHSSIRMAACRYLDGWLCVFFICVLGCSVQNLHLATPSVTEFVTKVWALSPGCHLFHVRFYEFQLSCQKCTMLCIASTKIASELLRTQLLVISHHSLTFFVIAFGNFAELLLCYCFLFFQEVVHWSMHSLLFELQKHINPMFCKT